MYGWILMDRSLWKEWKEQYFDEGKIAEKLMKE